MILAAPNSSEKARCYRCSQRNFISKEQSGEDMGSRTGLVRRNRTRSAWERERAVLVLVNALEGDARARGLLESAIRTTKRVPEPTFVSIRPWGCVCE